MAKNSKLPGWPDMLQPPFSNLAAGFAQGGSNTAAPPGLAGGMDFMKGLWGGAPSSVPGFVLPTLDIKELDKRIEDLRSVESWLALNANMLKATIQGLEVQRNTLAALQALREDGGFFGAMMKPAAEGVPGLISEALPETGTSHPAALQNKSKAAFAEAFRQSFGAGAGNPNWPLPLEPDQVTAQAIDHEPPPEVAPHKVKKHARKKANKTRSKQAALPANSASVSSSAAQSANLWMNFLRDQFGQIANAALAPAAAASPANSSVVVTPPAIKRPAKKAAGGAARGRAKPPARAPAKPLAKRAARRRTSGA